AMNDVDEITRLVRGNACCLVAAIGFALNYLPVKKYDTGDGIFFCAAMSVGILGEVTKHDQLVRSHVDAGQPGLTGLGLGLTMWDLSNMLVGWFIGHFGLFGVDKEIIQHPLLNYVGLVLASVSLIFFSLSSVLNSQDKELSPSKKELREDCNSVRLKIQNKGDRGQGGTGTSGFALFGGFGAEMFSIQKRGLLNHPNSSDLKIRCAPCAPATLGDGQDMPNESIRGCPNVSTRTTAPPKVILKPVRSLQDGENEPTAEEHDHPAAVNWLYDGDGGRLPTDLLQGDFGKQHSRWPSVEKKSYAPRSLVIPALSSGVIWGIAQVAWFQANLDLGFSVSFPVIALLIGICCFGEVESFWSRVFAALGLLLRIPARESDKTVASQSLTPISLKLYGEAAAVLRWEAPVPTVTVLQVQLPGTRCISSAPETHLLGACDKRLASQSLAPMPQKDGPGALLGGSRLRKR
ncbi:unnamed protein product, partial [Cladocopium goreaui]